MSALCDADVARVSRFKARSQAAGEALGTERLFALSGKVAEAHGTLVRVTGLDARIGEMCLLHNPATGFRLEAEVVGISRSQAVLTPLGGIDGIGPDTEVTVIGSRHEIAVGEALLGRVLDAHGRPMDDAGPLDAAARVPVQASPPNPLQRRPIERILGTGVKAVDAALTCGEGQRIGIFAPAGAGKSTLLGMIARGSDADVTVVALVGERGREVNEFIEDNLGRERLSKSVVVVATSDRPAMERAKAAYVATAIAEYFRDQGKRVLLLVDSVTRFARALRDIGLSVGEPPARRGFPPSVFGALPGLFERAGNDRNGSITAFYTVLLEDEDMGDPIAEEVRSILDGHICLSRALAAAHHYPAIDVLASASRVMNRVAEADHAAQAGRMRALLAKYRDIELLLQLGEYKPGGDADADDAIRRIAAIRRLLQQPSDRPARFEDTRRQLAEAIA
jgi:ATP synthase in type III secretion protein N